MKLSRLWYAALLLVLACAAVPPASAQGQGDMLADTFVIGVRITLDQSTIMNWNEIDAVELVGTTEDGETLHQWASSATATSQYGDPDWSAAQATGAPDTFACHDAVTAWASSAWDSKEQLTLMYETPVLLSEVNIYQTYHPGAIVLVEAIPAITALQPLVLFEGTDPGLACPGVLSLRVLSTNLTPPLGVTMVDTVTISFDLTLVENWNEIDAVELVGLAENGELLRQWAVSAEASSQYSSSSWSAAQATGAPDTSYCGTAGTAWASEKVNGQEWLEVSFKTPVFVTEINIYQTHNPGAIVRVEGTLGGETGPMPGVLFEEIVDPGLYCPGILHLDAQTGLAENAPGTWVVEIPIVPAP